MAAEDGEVHPKFVAGGQEATLNWQQWLDEGIDAIFLGLAEKPFLAFCQRVLTSPAELLENYMHDLPGVAYVNQAGTPIYNPAQPLTRDEFRELCASEGVEATVIGQYTDTQRLVLKFDGQEVGDLGMDFLHGGRPPVVRETVWNPDAAATDR